jgi:hydroxyethylthiazole kinase-like uncharacterized protein yjeF
VTLTLPTRNGAFVRVASGTDAAAIDAAAIAAGIPSRALMRAAGAAAAAVIVERYGDRLRHGATVYTGPGNNGGDGWIVAAALARAGVAVHVAEIVPSKSPDAVAERAAAYDGVVHDEPGGGGVVIDAMLGTGATEAPRGAIADAITRIAARRTGGDVVVALDIPTGVDATHGASAAHVVADLTISFGTCKRGQLLARDACGDIAVVDIGLPISAGPTLPVLIDRRWVAANVPVIPASAHKGVRKKLAVIAGGEGMGGAGILATTAAMRSGIGMVQVVTDRANLSPLQTRVPEALTKTLPLDDAALESLTSWANVLLIGPGLPANDTTRTLVHRLLRAFDCPVVLDAGALAAYGDDLAGLAADLRNRLAVITPHPLEFARLAGTTVDDVVARQFDVASQMAKQLGATVLLKGTPTVITAASGARFISATGTAALGASGSGDTLAGIVATLLAQSCEPHVAAACGAWIHGRAAERCAGVRGVVLDDIVAQLPPLWREVERARDGAIVCDDEAWSARYPVIDVLRSVG